MQCVFLFSMEGCLFNQTWWPKVRFKLAVIRYYAEKMYAIKLSFIIKNSSWEKLHKAWLNIFLLTLVLFLAFFFYKDRFVIWEWTFVLFFKIVYHWWSRTTHYDLISSMVNAPHIFNFPVIVEWDLWYSATSISTVQIIFI
jgi:hypothetical protein